LSFFNDQFLSTVIPLKGYFPYFLFPNDDYTKIYSINNRSDNIFVIDVASKTEEKVIDLHEYLPTHVRDEKEKPIEHALSQNYPNPFNATTNILFSLPEQSFVTLKIFDILGSELSASLAFDLPNNGFRRSSGLCLGRHEFLLA
jgi:YVTN family beta-propeller protein